MVFIYTIILAVSLALDAFAASLSCGLTRTRSKVALGIKVGSFFGGFQFLMFVLGWSAGNISKEFISSVANWIAFLLLAVIGSRMIFEALKGWKEKKECRPLSRWDLMMLSIATSIDGLVVGLTFGVLGINILLPAILVGSVAFILSFIGVLIGHRLRGHLDRWAEIVAGAVIISIGMKFLFDEFI